MQDKKQLFKEWAERNQEPDIADNYRSVFQMCSTEKKKQPFTMS